MSLKSPHALVGWLGYSGPLVLIFFYFLWEGGPCHRSRTAEALYKCCVLLAVHILSEVLGWHGDWRPEDNILRVMRMIMLYSMINQFVQFKKYPRFCGNGRPTQHLKPTPSPRARQVAEEVDNIVSVMVKLHQPFAPMHPKIACPLLYIIAQMQHVVTMFPGTSLAVACVVFSYGMFWALTLKVVFDVFSRLCRHARHLKQLQLAIRHMTELPGSSCLQYVLVACHMTELLELAPPSAVRELVKFVVDNGQELTLGKAALIEGFQAIGLWSNKARQKMVHDLMLSSQASETSVLKNLLDSSGGYHNLYKLMYYDISDRTIRERIISHLAAQAWSVRDKQRGRRGIKILSDVDDTLYSSGGHFPAGVDKRLPKHAVYPGCLPLFRLLDQEVLDPPPVNVIFLSARPHVYKDVAELKSYKLFKHLVRSGSMHRFPTLLPGRLRAGLEAILTYACRKTRAWTSVARNKFDTYRAFRRIYGEYDFVFFGDNGQGDLLAGQQMVSEQLDMDRSTAKPANAEICEARLIGVFIHSVMREDYSLAKEPVGQRGEAWRSKLQDNSLFFYRTYLGAAIALHSLDPATFSAAQLRVVGIEALRDLDELRLASLEHGAKAWESIQQDLQEDCDKANVIMQAVGLAKLPNVRSTEELRLMPYSAPEDDRSQLAAGRKEDGSRKHIGQDCFVLLGTDPTMLDEKGATQNSEDAKLISDSMFGPAMIGLPAHHYIGSSPSQTEITEISLPEPAPARAAVTASSSTQLLASTTTQMVSPSGDASCASASLAFPVPSPPEVPPSQAHDGATAQEPTTAEQHRIQDHESVQRLAIPLLSSAAAPAAQTHESAQVLTHEGQSAAHCPTFVTEHPEALSSPPAPLVPPSQQQSRDLHEIEQQDFCAENQLQAQEVSQPLGEYHMLESENPADYVGVRAVASAMPPPPPPPPPWPPASQRAEQGGQRDVALTALLKPGRAVPHSEQVQEELHEQSLMQPQAESSVAPSAFATRTLPAAPHQLSSSALAAHGQEMGQAATHQSLEAEVEQSSPPSQQPLSSQPFAQPQQPEISDSLEIARADCAEVLILSSEADDKARA